MSTDNMDLPPETEQQKAERLKKNDEAEKLQRRKDLGATGKLWTIEALFREGNETKRTENRNFTWPEVMEFRSGVYTAGLLMQLDPRQWRVISPYDVLDIRLIRQTKYYE